MKKLIGRIEDDTLRTFIERTVDELKAAGVKIKTSRPGFQIKYPDSNVRVAGYFVCKPHDSSPEFGFSVTNDDEWVEVFLHEYCHFQQWREGAKAWNDAFIQADDGAYDEVCEILGEWHNGSCGLTREELHDYCRRTRDLELDCEKRVVELIQREDLNIDWQEYTQRANSYIISYSLTPIFGDAYVIAPSQEPRVWQSMPIHFDIDYDTKWHEYVSLFWKHCYDPGLQG